MSFNEAVENVGKALDAVGVAAIVIGALVATLMALRPWPPGDGEYRLYHPNPVPTRSCGRR